jgi:GDP-L-fucose synthase
MRKIHEAQAAGATHMTIWGTGAPRREFMHVDDLADACLFLMQRYDGAEPVNVGCGQDLTIGELAQTLARVIGFAGRFEFDSSKPDGTPRKMLDVSRLDALGWHAGIDLEAGVAATYDWYCKHVAGRQPATAAA